TTCAPGATDAFRVVFFYPVLSFPTCAQCIKAQGPNLYTSVDGTYSMHDGEFLTMTMENTCNDFFRRDLRSESTQAYIDLISAVKDAMADFFGCDMQVAFCHSTVLASLGAKRAAEDNYTYENVLVHHIHVRKHVASSLLCGIRANDTGLSMDLTEYAQWFEAQYIDEGWDGWRCGALNLPGVTPHHNPIEAFHSASKGSAVLNTTAAVLKITVPEILRYGELLKPSAFWNFCF
ncbi:TPA: LOW QUALITY PROTEIN: hypothetical protein N0F65_001367, partial [Lagenidium giganteum]